jgi:serine/threonine-protein kinase
MGRGAPSSDGSSGVVPPVSPGDILAGKYRVERVLGVGGMGVVVAATHIDLRERRAIKFMLPAQLADAEAVERFLREARASSRLRGEHVAKVHDVGRLENGAPYMVMEYLTGNDLRVLLKRRGSIPVPEAALYILQACEALAEAHGAGIVHRDIKPENLFLTKRPDGTPSIKVLDFGISKVETDLAITSTQAIMGSPYYMSPEQLRASRDVDPRADVWSLGVILYQLVTNNLPFDGANLTALIANVIFAEYPPASSVKLGLGDALDAIIARCLEKEVDRRYLSVAELARDLAPVAPSGAGQAVAGIARLLQPTGNSPSDHPSAYEGPDSAQPSDTELADVAGLPIGKPAALSSTASPANDAMAGVAATSGSVTTSPGGATMRSGDALATTAGAHGSTPTVVVAPSPALILAAGVALALVSAGVAFLVSRTFSHRDDVSVGPSPTTATPTAPASASSTLPTMLPTATSTPTVTVASTAADPPQAGGALPTVAGRGAVGPAAGAEVQAPPVATTAPRPAPPVSSGRPPAGKPTSKPAATGEPVKPPGGGDPFGTGRM